MAGNSNFTIQAHHWYIKLQLVQRHDDGVSIVRLQFIDDPGGKLLGRGVVVKERLGLGGSCCRRSSSIIVAGAGAVVVEPY